MTIIDDKKFPSFASNDDIAVKTHDIGHGEK